MALQPNRYADGDYTNGFNVGADRKIYPFLNYPTADSNTVIYEVSRRQYAVNYAPRPALGTYATDANAYLAEQTEQQINDQGVSAVLLRYARIPQTQVLPATRVVQRPVMHGVSYGTNYAVSYDSGATSTIFTTTNTVTATPYPNGVVVVQNGHPGQVAHGMKNPRLS